MLIPSIIKKYLMAATGFVMVGFIFVHMAGNAQMFAGAPVINAYAHTLQTLPLAVLWGFRLFLLLSVVVHVWMAILITQENRRARPEHYYQTRRVQASLASRCMGITGSFLLFFIIFHLLHFTLRIVYPVYQSDAFYTILHGERVYDVYKMMIVGFSKPWVAVFYIVCMALLCLHLSHGVSSMFQSLGWRNHKWRPVLDRFAMVYGWVIFLGFISVPVAVMAGALRQEGPIISQVPGFHQHQFSDNSNPIGP